MWIYFLIGVFFIFVGLSVHVFKWYFLIAGYNTMPKEKQANVDTEGLGRLMGIYGYINGGFFVALGVLKALGANVAIAPAIIFLSVSTVYLLIKAQKYDRNVYDKNGKLRKGTGKQSAWSSVITVVTLILVGILIFFSTQQTKVTINDDGVKIHGMYGETYSWDSIKTVKLSEELPSIVRRTNGSAVGSNLKGYFRTKELESVKLFVDTRKPPFIYLETDKRVTIFSMKEAGETKTIFEEISKRINAGL